MVVDGGWESGGRGKGDGKGKSGGFGAAVVRGARRSWRWTVGDQNTHYGFDLM